MAPGRRHFITYYRVSTSRQGMSGLGIEAQRAAVRQFLAFHSGIELASFTEVESGKNADRPQLQRAMTRCRQTRATLLVAKLDRLSRNAAFLLSLRDANIRSIAADMPDANETMIGFMAVMAQAEREAISARTKAALAAAKARGTRLGNPDLRPGTPRSALFASSQRAKQAKERAMSLKDVIDDARDQGKQTLIEIAEHLTGLGIPTSLGRIWSPMAVFRAIRYIEG
jgi:DNA invertase Pin-like site-specific DNA recombinase